MTPIRPGIIITDKGEVITSPAYIGRQYGDYPLQNHWREEIKKTNPEVWAWIEQKKREREERKR